MKPVRLAAEAAEELAEAALWYENQRPGLGAALLDEIERTFARIRTSPQSFPILAGLAEEDGAIRRALCRRFPYGVVFLELRDHHHVLAIAHSSREPGYWLNRIQS